MPDNRSSTILVILLGIALLTTAWAINRLAQFQQQRHESVVYTDTPGLQVSTPPLSCRPSRDLELDIHDYSYNVVSEPTSSRIYRYKTNLDAEPPIQVHILSIRGGSGRVVVSATEKPVWLVLLSTQPAIWHIERAPGASVERVVASQAVSEVHFSDDLVVETGSVLNLLFGDAREASPVPEIQVIPQSRCLASFQRFQEYEDRGKFIATLRGMRTMLGHPEASFQSAEHPSYFELPFRVPFAEPDVSVERLAAVAKLAEPPPTTGNNPPTEPGRPSAAQFAGYASMPRRDDVAAVTFANPAELLAALESYRQKGLLPSLMPASERGGRGLDVSSWYSLGDYGSAYTKRVSTGTTDDACRNSRNQDFLIIEGTDGVNIVKCAWGKQMYFMRGGDDRIDDSWEDDVIYAGPGNDVIAAGWGNDLIFFNYGWGEDVVEKTCHYAPYRPQDSAGAKKVNWSNNWPYKNFIVFGKDISEDDIVRVGSKFVHKQTGDSITLKNDCFNTVFWR
ncbi:MAG: hypothetical protein QNJ14_05195 [Woeseiaceae bacterium]|nr:hypothetical protein [Woeseiaceae bacterium]